MKKVTGEMLKIYKPVSNLDWLNYKIVRKADMTFHHIIKREHGGKDVIENGALLLPVPHHYLHVIEFRDIETYIAINKIFEIVNKQRYEPTSEQREIIEFLLQQFEGKHKNDTSSKGKKLIKYEYLQRGMEVK